MSAAHRPLSEHEFDALMKPLASWQDIKCVAVAVSGGPDSMALAFYLQRWAKAQSKSIKAFIVDHALRPESATEARETQTRLTTLGLETEILTWAHAPVVSRLHVTARKARYELLNAACSAQGIRHLFLAHQREDQAETVLMRLAKGTGIDGLAGMPSARLSEDVWLLRPLLSISKECLIATCQSLGLEFIVDPSNTSEKFARGRLRKVLPLLAEEGLTVDRLAETAERAAEAKVALDYYTLHFLHEASQRDAAGAISFDRQHLASVPSAIAERALIAALNAIHAEDYSPERSSLAPVLCDIRSEQEMPTRTLQGCLISQTPTKILLMREVSCITDSVVIKVGESILWDGRWRILVPEGIYPKNCEIRPLGNPPHEAVDKLDAKLRHDIPQGRIRAGLPAIWLDDMLIDIVTREPVDKIEKARAELAHIWPPLSI